MKIFNKSESAEGETPQTDEVVPTAETEVEESANEAPVAPVAAPVEQVPVATVLDPNTQALVNALAIANNQQTPQQKREAATGGYLQRKEQMRKQFEDCERVPVIVPLGDKDREGATLNVRVNHYPFRIKKGEMVMVPQVVADLVKVHTKGVDLKEVARQLGVTVGEYTG